VSVQEIEYRGFIAEYWDLLWGDTSKWSSRPSDGALIRRWWRGWYDAPERLQHTEDRYEIIVDGEIVASDTYVRSPALTWFPPAEALVLLKEAGFVDVHGVHDFTDRPVREDDSSFVVFGSRT
jgi:hypothetical protein